MTSKPVATAGPVVREVRSGTRDGMPTRVAIIRRTYATDRADLWDALTNSERLPRWFLPFTGDFQVGGRYQLEGNAGGTIESCQEPESFSVTWEMGPMMSWLAVTLTPDGDDGTVLELAHKAPVDPEMWRQFGPGAVGVGWDLALRGLQLHLESGAPVDPEIGAAFPLTPEGLEFVRQAAAAWAEAAVADRDEPGAAHAAAERTVAFYTTQPDADAPNP